jgi:L-lactate dehydrogenase
MKYLSRKIALIGCLGVDPVDIFSLAKNHWVEQVMLAGEGSEPLADIVNRMLDRWGLPDQPRVMFGPIEQAADAAIAIMNPYSGPCIGESRLESVRRKAGRLETDIGTLRGKGFNGKLLIITEPVDILTSTALQASGLDSGSVIGMGTNELDGPTVKRSTPSVWCTGMRGDAAFIDHCDPNCHHFESVVDDAAKIKAGGFNFSGNRVAGMALCVSRVCQAILNDEHEILQV